VVQPHLKSSFHQVSATWWKEYVPQTPLIRYSAILKQNIQKTTLFTHEPKAKTGWVGELSLKRVPSGGGAVAISMTDDDVAMETPHYIGLIDLSTGEPT
jgi:hypothetical protein